MPLRGRGRICRLVLHAASPHGGLFLTRSVSLCCLRWPPVQLPALCHLKSLLAAHGLAGGKPLALGRPQQPGAAQGAKPKEAPKPKAMSFMDFGDEDEEEEEAAKEEGGDGKDAEGQGSGGSWVGSGAAKAAYQGLAVRILLQRLCWRLPLLSSQVSGPALSRQSAARPLQRLKERRTPPGALCFRFLSSCALHLALLSGCDLLQTLPGPGRGSSVVLRWAREQQGLVQKGRESSKRGLSQNWIPSLWLRRHGPQHRFWPHIHRSPPQTSSSK